MSLNVGTGRARRRPPIPLSDLVAERNFDVAMSAESSTKSTYLTHIRDYLNFCRTHNLDQDPTPDTLSLYVASRAFDISPSTIETYLSGIAYHLEPFYPEVRMARKSPLVVRTLQGVQKRFARPVKRKDPLEEQHLRTLVDLGFTTSDYDTGLFVAMALTGFFALLRLGELTYPDITAHQSFRKLVLRRSTSVSWNAYTFTLPYHKADRFYQGSTVIVNKFMTGEYNVIALFQAYLLQRDHRFPNHCQLFLTSAGNVPTRSWFLTRLSGLFNNPNISGHSMRSGGATYFAKRGVPDSAIQKLGRWSSDAFSVYIRKHPAVLMELLTPVVRAAPSSSATTQSPPAAPPPPSH